MINFLADQAVRAFSPALSPLTGNAPFCPIHPCSSGRSVDEEMVQCAQPSLQAVMPPRDEDKRHSSPATISYTSSLSDDASSQEPAKARMSSRQASDTVGDESVALGGLAHLLFAAKCGDKVSELKPASVSKQVIIPADPSRSSQETAQCHRSAWQCHGFHVGDFVDFLQCVQVPSSQERARMGDVPWWPKSQFLSAVHQEQLRFGVPILDSASRKVGMPCLLGELSLCCM